VLRQIHIAQNIPPGSCTKIRRIALLWIGSPHRARASHAEASLRSSRRIAGICSIVEAGKWSRGAFLSKSLFNLGNDSIRAASAHQIKNLSSIPIGWTPKAFSYPCELLFTSSRAKNTSSPFGAAPGPGSGKALRSICHGCEGKRGKRMTAEGPWLRQFLCSSSDAKRWGSARARSRDKVRHQPLLRGTSAANRHCALAHAGGCG